MALAGSLVLHAAALLYRPPAPQFPVLPLRFQPTIEIGLEEALPGSEAPPPASAEAHAPEPPAPAPVARPAPRPRPPRPRPAPPPEPSGPPDEVASLDPDAGFIANAPDAGDAGETLLAEADAGSERAIPGLGRAAPDLAPAVPRGSLVTLLLRTDRLRDNPNGPRVRGLLQGIRDWQEVLGGTELDPLRDFDSVLLASANPFGDAAHPPDLFALLRVRADRRFLRATIEQMAGVRAPRGADAGTLREHFELPDASALPSASEDIWQRRAGAEVATLERYRAPRAFILLGEGLAAIAPPERVGTLLSVLARRPASALTPREGERASRLVVLLEAHSLRNLLVSPPGAHNPVPRRLELAVFETRETPTLADGGAELQSVWAYDSEADAAHAARLVRVFLQDVQRSVDQFEGSWQGQLAAGSGAVHFDRLRSALRAIDARAEGDTLHLEARLAPDEVAELLNVQRLAAVLQ